jgi:hypothetical protein
VQSEVRTLSEWVNQVPPLPLWLKAIVVLGGILLVAGAVIALWKPAMMVAPGEQINGAVHIYAAYFAARNLGLALMLLGSLALGARQVLNTTLILVALIQFIDAVLDCLDGRWVVVPAVLLIGVAFIFCSYRISGRPFWRLGHQTDSQP